jgi:hypothetical protein
MNRFLYSDTIVNFLNAPDSHILGLLARNNTFSLEITQRNAWHEEIQILKLALANFEGTIFFEYSIPRMGRRIDVVLIVKNVIFILEFKVGAAQFLLADLDQVMDYALDLKNFHDTSHNSFIAPILIATNAIGVYPTITQTPQNDNLLFPIKSSSLTLKVVLNNVLEFAEGEEIKSDSWAAGRYSPTPTIIEAAMALYNGHSVTEISRRDASAINLTQTTKLISNIINESQSKKHKSICFVTGVPGAGKTLVGLDIATKHTDLTSTSIFLSGNGPLVNILREALTRDKIKREKENGNKVKKSEIFRSVKAFIQNVHHFRDESLTNELDPPIDHVAIFDEAQRAWNLTQTAAFMQRKKGISHFTHSEPEFLISYLDRHKDWAVIVCLVGGGQEINTGEAGISEWLYALNRFFPHWKIYISEQLSDSEYAAGHALDILREHKSVYRKSELHLSVSLRSFRTENLSLLVKSLLDLNLTESKNIYSTLKKKYPIVLTRDLKKAKKWLRENARGSERYGIIVSSQAQRLKPYAIDVRSPLDPVHWFLDGKEDVRSSFYLEDVATEFHIQGLELDWACVTWDADFRFSDTYWETYSFIGDRWNKINKSERKQYLKNAYRVLLTRARQGMVIVVPDGDSNDPTRLPSYYNTTFQYLLNIGIPQLD